MSNIAERRVSRTRYVPPHIDRPEYVGQSVPLPYRGPLVRDGDTIAAMRVAGRIAARALDAVEAAVEPGVTTDELDRIGHEFLVRRGAYPSTLGYRGYPKSLCSSVNEVVCHGIPDGRPLDDGDIVNIDITAYAGGVHGDTSRTFCVGSVDTESRLLVQRTEEAMMCGIRAVRPGRRINAIGRAIQTCAHRFGYGVVRELAGHGVGPAFHDGLVVPHYDDPDADTIIRAGMTFTVEPVLTLGTAEWDLWDNGWTAGTQDLSRTAQFEHTIVVTDRGAEILTV